MVKMVKVMYVKIKYMAVFQYKKGVQDGRASEKLLEMKIHADVTI